MEDINKQIENIKTIYNEASMRLLMAEANALRAQNELEEQKLLYELRLSNAELRARIAEAQLRELQTRITIDTIKMDKLPQHIDCSIESDTHHSM